jgi:hypothetical protein
MRSFSRYTPEAAEQNARNVRIAGYQADIRDRPPAASIGMNTRTFFAH